MRLSPDGLAFLSHEEGLRTKPYQDQVGKWTIGCGHLITADEQSAQAIEINGIPVPYLDGITLQQVQDLLAQDCASRETALSSLVVPPLSANQFDALFSLFYNIGAGAFGRSQLLKSLNGGDWTNLEAEWLAFRYAGGQPILLGRREREYALWQQA
jgi:lysozyme